jgi:hypothetical protein
MVTDSKPRRTAKAIRPAEPPQTIPSPEKVRAMAAAIRRAWTPGERRRRASLARSLFLSQLIAGRR